MRLTPWSTSLLAKWGAVLFMTHIIKLIRSSHLHGWILSFNKCLCSLALPSLPWGECDSHRLWAGMLGVPPKSRQLTGSVSPPPLWWLWKPRDGLGQDEAIWDLWVTRWKRESVKFPRFKNVAQEKKLGLITEPQRFRLILATSVWLSLFQHTSYYRFCLTDEKTDSQRIYDMLKVILIASSTAQKITGNFWFHALSLKMQKLRHCLNAKINDQLVLSDILYN